MRCSERASADRRGPEVARSDGDVGHPASRIGSVVLACGPRDLHTVGLEAFGLLLERRGRSVVMLGALTPLGSLRKASKTRALRQPWWLHSEA